MTDNILVCCEVRDGYRVPQPDGSVAESGQRVLLSRSFAERWAERGAVDILDDDPEGDTAA